MISTPPEMSLTPDPALVARHLAGDGTAFAEIVARHQSAVCAVAFSGCGDVHRSEEIAQEVFVAAWRGLPGLKESSKLRAWLCGIARHVLHNTLRRDLRAPTAQADPLPLETIDAASGPRERAIGAEETALLWRTLEGLPEIYRDPLVLYYREQQSVAAVAEALDISEDLVRQRLARGRTLVGERMASVVEETLTRTGPSAAFTRSVLSTLPAGALGAATKTTLVKTVAGGGVTATIVKGGGLGAKLLAGVGALPTLATVLPAYLDFRSQYAASADADARRSVVRTFVAIHIAIGLGVIAAVCLGRFGGKLSEAHPAVYVTALVLGISLPTLVVCLWLGHLQRKRVKARPVADASHGANARIADGYEYRSDRTLLGLPLVHICVGGRRLKVAKGWIAHGGFACGGLFASGGFAIAPIALGGFAVGLLAFGGIVAGGLAIGGMAAALFAIGGMAIGWFAHGGTVMALNPDTAAVAASRDHGVLHYGMATLWSSVSTWSWVWLVPVLLIGWELLRRRNGRAR